MISLVLQAMTSYQENEQWNRL